jgi:membrane-associated phospholipid phosphatase
MRLLLQALTLVVSASICVTHVCGEDLYSLPGNLLRDYEYLATSPTRLDWSSTLITLGLIGLGGVLYTQDESIRDRIQDHKSSSLDNIATIAEKFGYWPADLAFLALYGGSGYLIKNEKMQETSISSLESFLVANSISVSVKYGVGRARPKRDKGSSSYNPFSFDTSDTSFPSGHATCAFSIASVFAEKYDNPWVGVVAYTLATSTAWERLYDDKHWATDVFAGAILGIVVGRSVVYLNKDKERSVSLIPVTEASPNSIGVGLLFRF